MVPKLGADQELNKTMNRRHIVVVLHGQKRVGLTLLNYAAFF